MVLDSAWLKLDETLQQAEGLCSEEDSNSHIQNRPAVLSSRDCCLGVALWGFGWGKRVRKEKSPPAQLAEMGPNVVLFALGGGTFSLCAQPETGGIHVVEETLSPNVHQGQAS